MIFSLEALRAGQGDSLMLHFGTPDAPRTVLIDGGPGAVYGDALKPRLQELRDHLRPLKRLGPDDQLPLDLIMVSHVDDDHIGGLLALTDELVADQDLGRPQWLRPKGLWHNTFGDLTGGDAAPLALNAVAPADEHEQAIVASISQGNTLRSHAEVLGWSLNTPLGDLVQAPEHGGRLVPLDADTSLLVLAPRADQLARLRKKWDAFTKAQQEKAAEPTALAAMDDTSPYNLSSIVCLAQQGTRRILLTGDARGDHVVKALDAAGVLENGKLHLDVLKLPHHGSIRNSNEAFFECLSADHYVISANGSDDNPDSETLNLIAASRPPADDAKFAIHLTYPKGQGDYAERLQKFIAEQEATGRTFEIAIREDPALSLRVDLGDAPFG